MPVHGILGEGRVHLLALAIGPGKEDPSSLCSSPCQAAAAPLGPLRTLPDHDTNGCHLGAADGRAWAVVSSLPQGAPVPAVTSMLNHAGAL